ncbi:MAG TPA: hypothetical protein VHS96_16040, partial [Bacteroidia bacterium]|nr:hypothetical protein [Bacteroidia bacterium]
MDFGKQLPKLRHLNFFQLIPSSSLNQSSMKHHYPRFTWAIGLLLMLVTQRGMAQTFVNPLPIPDTIDAAVINLSLDIETHNFNDFAVGQPLNDTL